VHGEKFSEGRVKTYRSPSYPGDPCPRRVAVDQGPGERRKSGRFLPGQPNLPPAIFRSLSARARPLGLVQRPCTPATGRSRPRARHRALADQFCTCEQYPSPKALRQKYRLGNNTPAAPPVCLASTMPCRRPLEGPGGRGTLTNEERTEEGQARVFKNR